MSDTYIVSDDIKSFPVSIRRGQRCVDVENVETTSCACLLGSGITRNCPLVEVLFVKKCFLKSFSVREKTKHFELR